MAEINVKIIEINNAIVKLQALKSTCNSFDTTIPTTIGGGKTVNEMEAIADIYKKMNTHFGELISNTISLLQNVRDSYVESDTKAAEKISGE